MASDNDGSSCPSLSLDLTATVAETTTIKGYISESEGLEIAEACPIRGMEGGGLEDVSSPATAAQIR
jgi:hypothetical protein